MHGPPLFNHLVGEVGLIKRPHGLPVRRQLQCNHLTSPGAVVREGLHPGEDDRARAVGLDPLTSRRQHPVRLVDPERNDRVGVLLTAKALVGVGRIEHFG